LFDCGGLLLGNTVGQRFEVRTFETVLILPDVMIQGNHRSTTSPVIGFKVDILLPNPESSYYY
jgi:hypothetical protein